MKIGFIVDNLGVNQTSYYALTNINPLTADIEHSFYMFFENVSRYCLKPLVPIFDSTETQGFTGTLIATSLSTAKTMLHNVANANLYFYVQDMEFLRPAHQDYIDNLSVYRNPRIKLITRSKSHTALLENYCNVKPVGECEDFDMEVLLKILQESETS